MSGSFSLKRCASHFEAKNNGKFRISLTYDNNEASGKSRSNTDTYRGYFKTLAPYHQIVEVIEFESKDADFNGEMTITTELFPEYGGAMMVGTHNNLPLLGQKIKMSSVGKCH